MPRRKVKSAKEEDPELENPGKAVVSRGPSRKRKGYLKDIPNLPLDILHEIFTHLEPLDLLHLARINKAFRSFLMSRRAAWIWKSSRQNIEGLPDCPSHLNEPQYANLMFSSHCHNCLTGNVHNVIFAFSIRYCSTCKKEKSVDSFMLGGRNGYAGGMTAEMFCQTFAERRRIVYHKPEVEELWHLWLAIPEGDEEARENFRESHKDRVKNIQEHAALCTKWLEARKASRSQELDQLKRQKLTIVVEKLRAQGWGDELDDMKPSQYFMLSDHSLVRQAKKMNDKIWQGIEPQMIKFMESCRKTRLVNNRRKQLKTRLSWLSDLLQECSDDLRDTQSDYRPDLVDYAMMPEFREIAERPGNDVTREDFLALRHKFPNFTFRWQSQTDSQLSRILRNSLNISSCEEPLVLAMAFFDCTSCRKRGLQFPSVVAHECLHPRYWSCRDDGEDVAYFYEDVAQQSAHCRPWTCQNLVASRACERARKVIQACGVDPEEASRPEMDKLNPRLCCKTCSRPQARLIMGWRTAVEHYRIAHSDIDQVDAEWELVPKDEEEKAKDLEEAGRHSLFEEYFPLMTWSCARCADTSCRSTTINRALDHVRRQHSIQNPSAADGDIYISGDSPLIIVKPVLLVSDQLTLADLTSCERKCFVEGRGRFYSFTKLEDTTT